MFSKAKIGIVHPAHPHCVMGAHVVVEAVAERAPAVASVALDPFGNLILLRFVLLTFLDDLRGDLEPPSRPLEMDFGCLLGGC